MQKLLQKILLFIAVITVVGHNTLPHHHHEIQAISHHYHHEEEQGTKSNHHDHDENTENQHNIFSFAQLDENFVPVKFHEVSIELPLLYLVAPVIDYQLNLHKARSKPQSNYYREFPPPGKYLSNLFSRPPPTC